MEPPSNFAGLIGAEIHAIVERRGLQPPNKDDSAKDWVNGNEVVGLAISGGGIRSATFALGVIQTLAEEKLLSRIDYLSTVSGGGYIGGWLLALIQRNQTDWQTKLEEQLRPPVSPLGKSAKSGHEHPAIGWLREFSNYLAPRLGIFSADIWAIFTIWLRNTLLNQFIIASLFGALLLMPNALTLALGWEAVGWKGWCGIAMTSFVAAMTIICVILRDVRRGASAFSQKWAVSIAGLLVVSAVCAALALSDAESDDAAMDKVWWITISLVAVGSTLAAFFSLRQGFSFWAGIRALASAVAASAVFVQCLDIVGKLPGMDAALYMVVVPAVILLLFALQVVLVIGFVSRAIEDPVREWWARIGAWLCILSFGLACWIAATFWGPLVIQYLIDHAAAGVPAAASWIGLNVLGVRAGASADTSGRRGNTGRWKEIAAKAAPPLFAIGVILLISWAVEGYGWQMFLALTGIYVALSFAIDVNQFSMHNFYRNRLVRCYLGASSVDRGKHRDALTNLAGNDDVPLADLRIDKGFTGPVAILNGALNLASPDPGKQERRAASFVFSPYYCGFGEESYRQTDGTPCYLQDDKGVTLGQAMTVSGAAASPNMGYHTSAPVALLMSVFNVRLGWWFPNPLKHCWTGYGPRFGGGPLFQELFALADDKSDYIYVSDGGHFENLAVYELLRRRCRYIICSDAEEDGNFTFGGLGGLIQKARSDFGIEIEIDTSGISTRDAAGHSKSHCAVGTIWYPEEGLSGTLLYLKASVTGDETGDILQYQSANKAFPHQTTGDQFFSESQFESYRRLGYHVAMSALRPARGRNGALPELRQLFLGLKEAWAQAPRYAASDFTALSGRLDTIMERLRKEPDLAFLVPEIYPQWSQLTLPQTNNVAAAANFQSAFFFCHSLIQLMEDAYTALNLEENFEHPDVYGWINLFRHWAGSPRLQLTYSVVACTFGNRFQRFCERQLQLRPGTIRVEESSLKDTVWNYYERGLLEEMCAREPLDIQAIRLDAPQGQTLTVGFAVVSKSRELRWIRVQNHVRRMGHGRAALTLLATRVTGFKALDCEQTWPWCETDSPRKVRWVETVLRQSKR